MSRKQRSGNVELNFDGLTDSVTNLVGALILLVVLIIGITREAVSQPALRRNSRPGDAPVRQKSIRPLQNRVNLLRAQINGVDRNIDSLKRELKQLSDEIDRLMKKANQIRPPRSTRQPPGKTNPPTRTARYRLPLRRIVTGKKVATFIVENGRVSYLDGAALNTQLRKAVGNRTGRIPLDFEVPGTDFRVRGTVTLVRAGNRIGLTNIALKVVRKANAPGEMPANALRPASRYQQALNAVSPNSYVIKFLVYPDSFEAFRQIRTAAFQRKFQVGWDLLPNGEPVRIRRGGGRGTGVDF